MAADCDPDVAFVVVSWATARGASKVNVQNNTPANVLFSREAATDLCRGVCPTVSDETED